MDFKVLGRTMLAAAAVLAGAGVARAQHQGHQMPAATAAPEQVATCSQNSQAVTATLDAANTRIEDARQSNNAAAMRAAVGDLQVALAQMKLQLADCVGLSESAMSGMDHSKMTMLAGTPMMQPGSPTPAPTAPTGAPIDHSQMDHSKMPGMGSLGSAQQSKAPSDSGRVTITFRSRPAPLRSGENAFEVTLKDCDGKPINDAEVSLGFYMPPMPSMKMPEMRNTVKLAPVGNGVYRGSGMIGMAGDWEVTITATRKGQPLGVKKLKVIAK